MVYMRIRSGSLLGESLLSNERGVRGNADWVVNRLIEILSTYNVLVRRLLGVLVMLCEN